jgi:predicted ATPase
LATQLDQQLLRQAQSVKDPALLALAHRLLGITSYQIGETLLAREQLEMALSFYDRERDRPRALLLGVDPGSGSLTYLGMTLWILGYPEQALKKGKEGVASGQGLAHANCGNEVFLATVHQFRREAEKVQRAAENVIAVAADQGFALWSGIATFFRGWAMIEQGHGENISQMREGLAAYRATEAQVQRPQQLSLLAAACTKTGRLDEGLDALNEASAVAEQNEEHNWDAEIHRLRGELLLKQEDSNEGEAQRSFQRAIEIARKQSARSWSCARRRALRGCSTNRVIVRRHARCSRRSTAGSPRASTPPI